MTEVLWIRDDTRWAAEIVEIENLTDLAWLTGGSVQFIGMVSTSSGESLWGAYGNDDAENAGMKFNSRATFLAERLGQPPGIPLYGPWVFVGPGTGKGRESASGVTSQIVIEALKTGMSVTRDISVDGSGSVIVELVYDTAGEEVPT